jgi:hypothetical protein
MGMNDQERTGQEAAPAAPADETEDTDADVAGHLHPVMQEEMGRARQQDFMAEADRDRRGAQARPTGRDGGILDKIRRRTER